MKPPMCKLCGKAHWTYEDHYTGASAINPDYIQEMAAGAMGYESAPPVPVETIPVRVRATIVDYVPTPPPDVPTDVPTPCGCGKPREGRYKKCAACRKAAYRERSKG